MRIFSLGLLLSGIACLGGALQASAGHGRRGFVDIGRDQQLYVDFVQGDADKPVLVLINGLTYKIESWDHMMPGLLGHGNSILRYDPRGMGQTLLKYAPIRETISIKTQADDLAALLRTLGITKKVTVLGLSYGGGIAEVFAAKYPSKVESMILMAPYTAPIQSQVDFIKKEIAAVRLTQPWNTATDEELSIFFLRQLIYTSSPLFEPVVLSNPFILEAMVKMTLGLNGVLAKDLIRYFPAHSVHLMVAGQDQYIPREMMDTFWSQLPAGKRVSRINIAGTEHKMPDGAPNFSSAWVNLILAQDPRIADGRVFEASDSTGEVRSGSIRFKLPRN